MLLVVLFLVLAMACNSFAYGVHWMRWKLLGVPIPSMGPPPLDGPGSAAFTVDSKVAPYYELTFILGALVFCDDCKLEITYTSAHARYTDQNYYDAAIAMQAAGWVVVPNSVVTFCPSCAAKRGLRLASGAK